jgi:hypothetical protein
MKMKTALEKTVRDYFHSNEFSSILFFLDNFDSSLLDMEPLFDPLDDITMSSSLTDDYTNQSTLSYLISSQSRRISSGKISTKHIRSSK